MTSHRRSVKTDGAPAALGPYAQGVVVGNTLYVSGQIGLDPTTGRLVPGGIAEQTARALQNVLAVVEAAAFSPTDVVKTTVYLRNLEDFPAMNEVYGRQFREPYPARATVEVSGLPGGAAVEIEAVAVRG